MNWINLLQLNRHLCAGIINRRQGVASDFQRLKFANSSFGEQQRVLSAVPGHNRYALGCEIRDRSHKSNLLIFRGEGRTAIAQKVGSDADVRPSKEAPSESYQHLAISEIFQRFYRKVFGILFDTEIINWPVLRVVLHQGVRAEFCNQTILAVIRFPISPHVDLAEGVGARVGWKCELNKSLFQSSFHITRAKYGPKLPSKPY